MSGQRRRLAVACFVAVGILAAVVSPVAALSYTAAGYTYQGTPDCAHSQIWIGDDNGRPSLTALATEDWQGTSPCSDTTHAALRGTLAVAENLYYWVGQQWMVCNGGPWVVNNGSLPTHEMWTGYTWASPPCGTAYYYARGMAATYNISAGRWDGVNASISDNYAIAIS